MKKTFYNSTQWGIQEKDLNQIRSRGLEYLDEIGIKTNKHYFFSIEEAIKNTSKLNEIFGQGIPFLVLLEPNNKNNKKIGRFNVKDKKTLYEMINTIDPNLWKGYIVSLIEQIQENGKEFVGTAISDGKGKLFIEFLKGTTNSKKLTSTGANPTKIESCCFSDFDTPVLLPKEIPIEVVESIKKDCQYFKGYYEFVYGKSESKDDIYYTFYSNIDAYLNILDSIDADYTEEAVHNRLKYHYLKSKQYFEYDQSSKEDER